jgi:hypothetical protein
MEDPAMSTETTSACARRRPGFPVRNAQRTASAHALLACTLAALIAIAMLAAGCSNVASPEEETDDYPLRTSPAGAIEKMRQAYAEMDTTAFADCLAGGFEFWLNPNDLNDPDNTLPDYWGFTEETAIAGTMFGPGTDVESIQLTLTQIGTAVEIEAADPADPSGWELVYSVDLYVYLPNDLTLWANAASRFQMFADPDDIGPSGETLWEVVKWEDIDTPGGATAKEAQQNARGECSTWGSVKAMFRTSRGERKSSVTWGGIKALYR